MTRSLGDRIGQPRDEELADRALVSMELVELAHHMRDRRAEREDIELGWLDLGEID